MQAADNVELGDSFRVAGCGCLPSFFQCHGVGAGLIFLTAKCAEATGGHADIRGIDMPIDVEIADVAVLLFANMVCEPADGQEVARAKQGKTVVKVQTLASHNFGSDRLEGAVVRLERMRS